MDPIEFERRCAEAMRLAGWTARTTKGSGDQGVDVLAERDGVRVVLQCKRYSNSVGNKAVQEAFAAKTFAKAQHAAVVTNSKFTSSARTLAASTEVLLLHFTDLARPNRLFGLVDKPSLHRPSDITQAQISALQRTRIKPSAILIFGIVFAAALIKDLLPTKLNATVSSDVTSLEPPPSSTEARIAAPPEAVPTPAQVTPPQMPAVATPISRRSPRLKPQDRSSQRTQMPAFINDGDTFCAAANDFDSRWHWMLSGDQAHEPSTPSCILIFGQPHPMRISVLRRVSSSKTRIKIEEGDLAGRTGYTSAYVP